MARTRVARWLRWLPLGGALALLVGLRARVILDPDAGVSPGELLSEPLVAFGAWQNLVRSLAVEGLVLIAALALLRVGRAGAWLARALLAVLLVANVAQVAVFDYWNSYLSGYQLVGPTASELGPMVSANLGTWVALALVFSLIVAAAFGREGAPESLEPGRRGWALMLVLAVAFSAAAVQVENSPLAYPTAAQGPILALARTRPAELARLPDGVPMADDWKPAGVLSSNWTKLADVERPLNVVVLLLESIRARSFWPSPEAPPMPNLERAATASAVFTRAYGHSPQSIRGFEALLFGTYPPPTWQTALRRSNDIGLDSLAQRLSERGVRTAVLLNGDDRFDDQGPLLTGRGLEHFAASTQISGPHPPKSDLNLVAALERFIDTDAAKPFAAVLMTRETHFPYVPVEPISDAPRPASYEAYMLTVARTDRLIGEVLALLERKGVRDDTVVVLTADHGQSFDDHSDGGRGHGQRVYEDSLHLPLVFINPVLFHGERDDRVVQLMDVGATVAWLAGDPRPNLNSGASVFHERASRAAYLVNFADGFSGAVVHGRFKYHYVRAPGEPDSEKLFDVLEDPRETKDLAATRPELRAALRARYFGWFHHWNDRWEEATSGDQTDRERVSAVLLAP